MKNVERTSGQPVFCVPIHGLTLKGWAVRYVSGVDDTEIKSGYWLSQWSTSADRMSATFAFEPKLVMSFGEKLDAKQVSDALWKNAEIETKVVKIG